MNSKYKPTKYYSYHKTPKVNPAVYAKDLIKTLGITDAFKMAKNLNDMNKKIDSPMDYMTFKEIQSNKGFWQTVFGYINKRNK